MPQKRKHYENIDISRGIAILLVVIGHALSDICSAGGRWNSICSQYLFILIYTFHMPLFVFISGFCSHKIIEIESMTSKRIYIIKKFRRLMIPYFTWGFFYVIFDIVGGNYSFDDFNICKYLLELIKGDNANWQLWTLYTLFVLNIVCIFFLIILKISLEKILLCSGLLFIMRCVINGIPGLPYCLFVTVINESTMLMFFFCLGLYCRNEDLISKIRLRQNRSMIFFIMGMLLINAYFAMKYIGKFFLTIDFFKIVGGPIGIFLIVYISSKKMNDFARGLFIKLGVNSMNIYIFANIFQVAIRKIYHEFLSGYVPSVVALAMSIFIGIVVPILIYKFILTKNKLFRLVLIGEI